jgi:hypothetical protein
MRSEDSPEVFKMLRGPRTIGQKTFVPILYRNHAFEAFDDFSDFVESTSCEPSESCQVRGSNPCRGANLFFTVDVRLLRHCMIPEAPNVSPPQSCRWQKNYALPTLN